MRKFSVNYLLTCSGTVEVEAESQEAANRKAEDMPVSELAREADNVSVEILPGEA